MSYVVRWTHDDKRARLLRNVWIKGYQIPKGFRWDGASIPVIFISILMLKPFDPRIREASLLHDYMYVYGLGRGLADKYFRQLTQENGLDPVRAWVMWAALRIGGWLPYRRSRKEYLRKYEEYVKQFDSK